MAQVAYCILHKSCEQMALRFTFNDLYEAILIFIILETLSECLLINTIYKNDS